MDVRTLTEQELNDRLAHFHDQLQAHTCILCEMNFPTAHQLDVHFWDHTDTHYVLVCLVCDKPFISKDELQTHVREHCGSSQPVNPNQPMFKLRTFCLNIFTQTTLHIVTEIYFFVRFVAMITKVISNEFSLTYRTYTEERSTSRFRN